MVQEKGELLKVRLLYIGSAVPLETADGLESVQKPLAHRYPTDNESTLEGIVSYVAIVKDGITLQYDSDLNRILFFPIGSLKLCAAVRCVTRVDPATEKKASRFMSLSDPEAQGANSHHPAIFTFVTRRSEGRKLLECHGFVCSSDKDALDLVACTSAVSRQYKERTNGVAMPPSFESMKSVSTSTSTVTAGAATPVDHPVRLVAGGDSARRRVAPEFYEPPPEHGYFYKTADSQVKSYTIERVVAEGGSERLRAISPNAPTTTTPTLPRGPPVGERRPVYGGPPPGFMTLPPPQGRQFIPVRVMPPQAVPGRPRFFSPPPPMLRPHPMAMPPRYMMGPEPYVLVHPGAFMEPNYVVAEHPPRRRGFHSSRGSSGSSSPGSPREANGQPRVNGAAADGSTDAGSRPHTPPTDYEKGPRISQKDQFEHSQHHHLRQVNVDPALYGHPPNTPHPYGMYMMYPPPFLRYPPQMTERARSVPPTVNRSMYKESKKSGKSKKDKKKKSGKHRNHGAQSDVSTDSMGYTSEVGPGGDYPRMPRDFRRFENQFKHERAFSKSLKEEGYRGAPQAQNPGNAYSLNEHMSRKGKESDFNLY